MGERKAEHSPKISEVPEIRAGYFKINVQLEDLGHSLVVEANFQKIAPKVGFPE